jgi:hypothetical protein
MHVQTQVTIAAPPARVWELLTDAANYPSWNPMVSQLSGDLEVGKNVKLRLRLAKKVEAPVVAEVVALTPERELRWVGLASPRWTRKVMQGEHYFVLRAEGDGTVLEHGERFTGWLVPDKAERIERALAPAYEAFNKAIKAKAEAAVEAKPAIAATA